MMGEGKHRDMTDRTLWMEQFSIGATCFFYLLAFFFLLHGVLILTLCFMAGGSGCCRASFALHRKKKQAIKNSSLARRF
jgi:Flp pilus assembly protein TadB